MSEYGAPRVWKVAAGARCRSVAAPTPSRHPRRLSVARRHRGGAGGPLPSTQPATSCRREVRRTCAVGGSPRPGAWMRQPRERLLVHTPRLTTPRLRRKALLLPPMLQRQQHQERQARPEGSSTPEPSWRRPGRGERWLKRRLQRVEAMPRNVAPESRCDMRITRKRARIHTHF